eukprot:SAG11_NODE_8429_length_1016_cov_1.376227_2_plen_86_part_00
MRLPNGGVRADVELLFGMHASTGFDEYPDHAWQKVMDLNVRGVFNLTQQCATLLEAAGVPVWRDRSCAQRWLKAKQHQRFYRTCT